jgi:Icc-related predicted phosphoesterase
MPGTSVIYLVMRIYAVADIHGKTQYIETLSRVSRKFKPDVIVIAGDITGYFRWQSTIDRLDKIGQLDKIGPPGEKSRPPVLCIRGNSDFKRMEPSLAKTKNLTLLGTSPHIIQGVPFVGTNGCIPLPFASRVCLGENQLFKTLLPHMDKNTILVAHPPPRGICDKVGNRFSAGSQNLLDFIKTTHPAMVLCGHIHEQAGMDFVPNCIPGTLVVNCAMNKDHHGAIIDLQQDTPPRVNFLQP